MGNTKAKQITTKPYLLSIIRKIQPFAGIIQWQVWLKIKVPAKQKRGTFLSLTKQNYRK